MTSWPENQGPQDQQHRMGTGPHRRMAKPRRRDERAMSRNPHSGFVGTGRPALMRQAQLKGAEMSKSKELTRNNWVDMHGQAYRVVARLWEGETDTGNREPVRYLLMQVGGAEAGATSIIGAYELGEEIHAGLAEIREYGSNLNDPESYHVMLWTSPEEIDRHYEIARAYDPNELDDDSYYPVMPEPFLAGRELVSLATKLPELSAGGYVVELTEYVVKEWVNKRTGEIRTGVETRHSYGRDYRRGRMLAVWYDGEDMTQEAALAEMQAIDDAMLRNAY